MSPKTPSTEVRRGRQPTWKGVVVGCPPAGGRLDYSQRARGRLLPHRRRYCGTPKGLPREKTLEADTLDFEKSRVGLGDVYAKQYEQEVLGNKKNPEEDKAKAEVHREGGRVLNA